LKERLPDHARLVSLGPIPHLFAYYYGEPIDLRPVCANEAALESGEYFCAIAEPEIPYVEVARINCDRSVSDHAQSVVIVGRSLGVNLRRVDRRPAGRTDAGPVDLWLGPAELAADVRGIRLDSLKPRTARH
jgi:hypothetical protein